MIDLTMPFTEMSREQFQAHLDQRSVNTHDAARSEEVIYSDTATMLRQLGVLPG